MDEIEVLLDVTARLEAAGMAYMLTGSLAANYYTTPRMTRDIDIVAELREVDAQTSTAGRSSIGGSGCE